MAGTAQAGQITATPTVTGAGSVTGTSAPCALQVTVGTQPTNSSSTTCGATSVFVGCSPFPLGGCLYPALSLVLAAVPVAGWQFDHWEGCPIPSGPQCIDVIQVSLANTTHTYTPTAFFKEIVRAARATG